MQTYLFHSSLILALLSIFYWLLLRRETFFMANRWLLLGNIVLAMGIPLLPKPAYIIQLKADIIESFQSKESITTIDNSTKVRDTTPLLPEASLTSQKENPASLEVVPKKPSLITEKMLKWIYILGFFIMWFRFLIQLFGVFQQIKRSEVTKGAGYYLATNNKDITPFSFWKYIVINPNKYNESSFIQILEHERIHITQRHTIDLVVAELFLIAQWCNPLAWWHRYLIGQNLELSLIHI